ncbi:MAG: hypothetical protein NTV34_21795 [Proteobacteria bacterium]|nr:hypothetical protein [Pseudomonadota bacterium]
MKLNYFVFLNTAFAFGFLSCGDSKKDESTAAPTCPSTAPNKTGGYVVCAGDAASVSLELTGGAGEQYVVSPFTLGDHVSVKGASDITQDFKVTATSAALQLFERPNIRLKELGETGLSDFLDEQSREDILRSIANRFDASRGIAQEPWIWKALERLGAASNGGLGIKASLLGKEKASDESLLSHYRSLALSPLLPAFKIETTLADNCPSTAPTSDGSSTVSLTNNYDGTSFCVGYSADPSGDSKENIQASVKAVLESYKDTIYQDKMTTNTKDGYAFNPIIVFVSSLAVDGAFSKTATTLAKRPILHIKASLVKTTLHATIAHEMQHAIVDYYKARGTTTIEETVAIDEGVAHLMEDVFGYGEGNFESYVKVFLTNFADGSAVLSADSGANAAGARGGSNSLIYFMGIRAGGFTVTSGKPFSGDALKAVVSMVKQTDRNGPSALAAAFSQTDLTQRVGQLIGALYSDNRELSFAPSEFISASYTGVTDVLGTIGVKFGLRFNNFGTFKTSSTNSLKDGTEGFKLKHYESKPILVTPTAASSTVTVTLPLLGKNSGISVARVK